jgi:hypothetical protein
MVETVKGIAFQNALVTKMEKPENHSLVETFVINRAATRDMIW